MVSRVQMTFLVLSAVIGAVLGRHLPLVPEPHPPASAPESVLSRGLSISVEASMNEVLKPTSSQHGRNDKKTLKAVLSDPKNALSVWGQTGICPQDADGFCEPNAQEYVWANFVLDNRLRCVQLSVVSHGAEFYACVLAKTRD